MPKPAPGSRLYGLSKSAIQSVVATGEALDGGRLVDADRFIVPALALAADHPEVLRLVAGMHTLRGQHAQAAQTMRSALLQRPEDAMYHNTLGTILIAQGDLDSAVNTLQRAVELDPTLAAAFYNLGLALMHSVRATEAGVALQRSLALAPGHAAARVMLADILRASGRTDAAVAEYRRVLAKHPSAGIAWWGLANLKTVPMSDHDIAAMRKAQAAKTTSDNDRIGIGFALAKALADRSLYADSLDAIAAANAIARRRATWDAAGFSRTVTTALDAFTPPPQGADANLGAEAIFIVSMPRSGSTLIEQILASHSQVNGTSELPDIPLVLTEESQRRGKPFPTWVADVTPADWTRMGRRYLERTARWRQDKPRFTDKLLNNWFYLGAIRAMLPAARIVVARRDPLETCLSCYYQQFTNNEYTRTFDGLAGYWRDFDRAIAQLRTVYPNAIHECSYERLVADPHTTIRELLDFCGLPFEAACLDFHETKRDILTASAAQVREPLRNDTARAHRFGALLDPLRTALGMPAYATEVSA
jgi:Flp pilus assembly protein TadD